VPPDNVAQVKADTQLRFIEQPGPHIWWLSFNLSKPPFNDRRVRQAAVQAINKEAIVRDILKGTATVATGPIPPAIDWAYTPEVQTYPYDPAQAKKLLAEAGYTGGVEVVLWIPESGSGMQSPKTMAQAIQADLAAVGIRTRIGTFEWGTYLSKYNAGLGKEADLGA